MEPCLNPACLPWGTSFADFIVIASNAGFHGIEFAIQQALTFVVSSTEENLRDLFRSQHVSPLLFSGLLPADAVLPAPLLIPTEHYNKAIEGLDQRLQLAATLGCSKASIVLNPRSSLEPKQARHEAINRLRFLADHATNYHIQIAVELIGIQSGIDPPLDGEHLLVTNIYEMLSFLNDVKRPNVAMLFDVFHWYASGGDIATIQQLPVGSISFFHINDVPSNIARQHLQDSMRLLPGKGIIPWKSLLEAISHTGYEGPASVEVFDPNLWTLEPQTAATLTFESITSCLASI